MSELTPCNYCSLNRIKSRAVNDGLQVTTKREKNGWSTVYVHPQDVTDFPAQDNGEPSEYLAASMMVITDHCVC